VFDVFMAMLALWYTILGPKKAAAPLSDKEVRIVRQPDRPLASAVERDLEACSIQEPHDAMVTLECCICLSPFQVVDGPIVPSSGTTTLIDDKLVEEKPSGSTNKESDCEHIVQTISCGHLFH
jgi:hypothetical protein